MAAASPWTHDQVAAAFQRAPELKNLLVDDVEDTGEMLGSGSYGKVVKLRTGATLCAGKMIHETLIDQCNEGAKDVVMNFFIECKLMSELRHPHIVQFMGVCLLPSSKIPVLLMELMSDCLHNFIETNKNLPLGIKQSFLTNVASALVYMHSRSPQIIHRDLTAKNVLVDERSMKAKVTDLGNSRFVACHKNTRMTRAPGTLLYMPPEALEAKASYCDKLDMFSFGHLSLYTITQVFPEELLAPNIHNPRDDSLRSRSEVGRRAPYMEILHKALGEDHALVKIVTQCLSNDPHKRLTAMEALQWLEDLNPEYNFEEVYALHRCQMVDIINQKDQEIVQLRRQMQARASERDLVPGVAKSGPLEKLSSRTIKIVKDRVWKSYTFKIVNDTHLKYFKTWIKIARGEIALSAVSNVVIAPRVGRERFCFEIHYTGSDSPWILAAYSVAERKSWMEAIRSRQVQRAGMPLKMNLAYERVLLNAGREVQITEEKEPLYEAIGDVVAPQPKAMPKKPALPFRPPHLGKLPANVGTTEANTKQKKQTKDEKPKTKAQEVDSDEPDYDKMFATLNRRAPKFTPTQLEHLLSMLKNAHCYDDKEKKKGEKKRKEYEKEADQPSHCQAPRPYYVNFTEVLGNGQGDHYKEKVKSPTFPRSDSKSPYYVNFREVYDRGRPLSRGNISDQGGKMPCRPRSASPTSRSSHYIDFRKVMEDLEEKPPLLSRRSHSDLNLSDVTAATTERAEKMSSKHPKPAPQPRHWLPITPSPYLLPEPYTYNNRRQTLKNILQESTLKQAPEALLVTEDTPEQYIIRPQWATANTNRPGPHTLAAMHRKALYIKSNTLTNVTNLGEGRFGMVYKAEMQRINTTTTVAVKSVAEITTDFRKEVTIMSEVVHPNIVRLYGLINEGEMAPAMVMEYLPNRDLKTFLSRNRRSKPQLMKYMIDVAMGMHYLSEKGIIHRDLAARNILVDKNEMCKVADFGLVREVPRECMVYISLSRGPSPLRWMAPESMSKGVFSPASDIWSYGILQWEMFNPNKLYPYPNLQNDEVMDKVAGGYLMPVPRYTPQLVVRIMKACWNIDPNKRPSFLLISKLLTGQMIGND